MTRSFSLLAQKKRTKRKGTQPLGPSDYPVLLDPGLARKNSPRRRRDSDSLRTFSARLCDVYPPFLWRARQRGNGGSLHCNCLPYGGAD
ncbi:hypothetical protein D3OALGB2SA_2425 [Olavius algarvensis associated proteobacterium Delta 3]|nr:hypothetical protein D3OALGB2SA_2425 [Olavius algarvensis associated proteobacterium Delta 3]